MDLKTNYDIILDIKRNNYVAIRTKQLDKNSRFINVSVTDNGEPLSLDSTVSAMFIVKKNDGNTSEAPANIDTENNKIICEINDNMSATPGMNDAEIQLLDVNNKTILTTMKFKIVVDSINSTIDDLLSSSEYKSLAELVIVGKEKLELLDKLIDEIDDIQANYDEAEQGRVAAETARVQAEKSRVSAESARVAAESKRASEESKRATAESSRETKESQRVEAETSRKQAETSRASAESGRVSAENTRVSNENARKSAETSRDNAEKSRVDAEQDRADAEEERITSESARKSAESSRVQTEANRVSAETSRANAETNRVNAEKVRVAAESSRATAETNRSDAENERVANENERKSAEASRVSAEASRVSAEQERVEAEKTRTTIHNGNGVPSSSLGKVGDVYIDKSDTASAPYNYYIKEASGWVAQGTMHGLNGSVVNYPNDSETDAPSTSLFEDAIVGGYLEQEGSTFSGATSDYGVDIHEIVGKTYQQTTNGYQLFDASKLPTKSQGGATVTNNGDGSFTVSGSGKLSGIFNNVYVYSKSEALKILSKPGTYKLSEKYNINSYPYFVWGIYLSSESDTSVKRINVQSSSFSFDLTEEDIQKITSEEYELRMYFYGSKGFSIASGTIKPMVYQDGDGTWELFTGGQPAPNPDYPMPIENVEISKISSINKNVGNFVIGQINQNNGADETNNTLMRTKNYIYFYDNMITNFKPFRVFMYDRNKLFLGSQVNYDYKIIKDSYLDSAYYIRIQVDKSFIQNGTQIEIGEVSTEYVPHEEATVETSLTLAEGEVYQEGQPFVRKRKKVVFDGSSDEKWSLSSVLSGRFVINISDAKGEQKPKCNMAIGSDTLSSDLNKCRIDGNGNFSINTTFNSVEEWKEHIATHNVEFEYELATPTTETIKVPTIPSYHPYTNIWTDSPIESEKIVWRAKTASGLSIENKKRLDQVQYDGLYAQGETYSGIASNKGIKLHKVVGKTTQQTTNGYQLFDASKLPTKTQGGATATNNNDGSFTISGSGALSEKFLHWHRYTHEETLHLLKTGKIYVQNNNAIPRMCAYLYYDNDTNYYTLIDASKSESNITEDMLSKSDCELRVYIYGNKGITIKPGTIKPMLYQDGDGTYELFTGGKPAPNPDYPMDIENVEISKIISRGRQLFDASKLPTKTQGGATVTNNGDGSFTITGSGRATATMDIRYKCSHEESLNLLKAGTLRINDMDVTEPYLWIDINYDGISHFIGNRAIYDKSIEITSDILSKEDLIMIVGIYIPINGVIKPGTIKPMLYQDGDGTWEKFKGATVETSLTLAEGDVYENGVVTRKRKRVVFDGSSDENWNMDNQKPSFIRFYIQQNSLVRVTDYKSSMKCNRFPIIRYHNVYELGVTGYIASVDYPGENWIYVNGLNEFETVGEFKTWLQTHPLEVEYELATPTIEELKVPTIPSYNPHTNILTDNTLPTDIEWELLANSDNSLQAESLEKRITALEATLINVVSLMPESVQATMIENDVNNLMNTI